MNSLICFAVLSALVAFCAIYKRFASISIAHIPGPKAVSFLIGNLGEVFQGQAGEADFRWQKEFGGVVRVKAPFGEDRLLISDPKALQYIYQISGYNFPKQPERRQLSRLLSGRGLLWAEGEDHKRHRKVMSPGFGISEAKAFLPLFSGYAAQLTTQWKDTIEGTKDQFAVFNIPEWLSRVLLDIIGAAAFDYKFGAMENAENPLGKAYFNLMADSFGSPTNMSIFVQSIAQYIPGWVLHALADCIPSASLARLRNTEKVALGVAKELVDSKASELAEGKGKRDVMSLLVRANSSADERTRLNEEEMLSQMRTMMFAGHETTANTLSWTLLELARNPDMQTKLRAEIRLVENAIRTRGDSEFTSGDFESMPYTLAVIKESLRFHPVSYNNFREAIKDDVLPLSTPITTTSGKVIYEIPVPKGLKVITSICGYNRDSNLFGEDSHSFKPERWLNNTRERKGPSVGVYSNLLSFAGGPRSCIGWRFALLELQAFLVELINNFEFRLTEDACKIRREACLIMVPTIEGEVQKGAQLPLRVSIALRE